MHFFSKYGSFLSPNDKSNCLKKYQRTLHSWVVSFHCFSLPLRPVAMKSSWLLGSRRSWPREHISSVFFCHMDSSVTTNEQALAQQLLWQAELSEAVLPARARIWNDFTSFLQNALIFSAVQAIWCNVINIAALYCFSKVNFQLQLYASFYLLWLVCFLVFIFVTNEVGNKELQVIKRGTHSYTEYSRGNTGKLAPSYH